MRVNSRRRNVLSPIKGFDRDLFPPEMLFYNNTPETLLTELVQEEKLIMQVRPCIERFRDDFVKSISRLHESSIPEFVQAAKRRANAFTEFAQKVMALSEQRYSFALLDKGLNLKRRRNDLPFVRIVAGIHPTTQKVDYVSVDKVKHPREYRQLYKALMLVILTGSTIDDLFIIAVILQSWAHAMYESVKFTDREIVAAEDEFLQSASKPSSYSTKGELAGLLRQLNNDIQSDNAPRYIADFRRAKGMIRRHLRDFPFTPRDTWNSLKSSGSKLLGVRYPNVGILTSLLETDYSDPIDEIIGYTSAYRTDPLDWVVQYDSLTMFVPKTSSRGLRAIHPQSNPKQDRGQYVENMVMPILKKVILADSTASHQLGVHKIKQWTFLRSPGKLLACTDIKAATDEIDHQFLRHAWRLVFPSDLADGFLRLHSGPGTIRRHSISRSGKMIRTEERYEQLSGIRCGTSSNFSVGLALPHHLIVRATMKSFGLDDIDPSELYIMVGDDVVFHLPVDYGLSFIDKYTSLAREAGFRVHNLSDKGKISYSYQTDYSAEFSKQDIINGEIYSRIPHRLFFKGNDPQSQLSAFIWLSKYPHSAVGPRTIARWITQNTSNINQSIEFAKLWNFFVNREAFNIPVELIIPHIQLSKFEEFKFSIGCFRRIFIDSIYHTLFDNRDRLSESEIQEKENKFFNLVADGVVNDWKQSFIQSVGSDDIGKYLYSLSFNEQLAKAVHSLFADPLLDLAIECGFLSSEEDQTAILEGIEICLHPEIVSDFDNAIRTLGKVEQIFKSVNPHSLAKSNSRTAKTYVRLFNDCIVESLGAFPALQGTAD